jgi:hypothetical protein
MGLGGIAGCLSEVLGKEIQARFRTEEIGALEGVHPIVESQVLSGNLSFEMILGSCRSTGVKYYA